MPKWPNIAKSGHTGHLESRKGNVNRLFGRTFYVFVGKRTLLNFTIKSQTQLLEQHFKAEKQIKSLIKGGLELIR